MGRLSKIKTFAVDYTRSFTMIVAGAIGIVVSAIMSQHGIAQWDMLFSSKMWGSSESNIVFYQDILKSGYWRFAEVPFQDSILFRSTAGNAYDFFLMLIAIGWALAFVSAIVMMLGVVLFYKDSLRNAQKQ